MKTEMITLLESILAHAHQSDEIKKQEQHLNILTHRDNLLEELSVIDDWEFERRIDPVDRESALELIDHCRREFESHDLAFVALWAAVIGAVAGAVISFVLLHL